MEKENFKKAVAIATKGLSFEIVKRSRLFPPLEVLNSFLLCGIDDAESGVSLQWEPFAFQQHEYQLFLEFCMESFGPLNVDSLGVKDFSEWFSKAVPD